MLLTLETLILFNQSVISVVVGLLLCSIGMVGMTVRTPTLLFFQPPLPAAIIAFGAAPVTVTKFTITNPNPNPTSFNPCQWRRTKAPPFFIPRAYISGPLLCHPSNK